jgi:hypothetical protein
MRGGIDGALQLGYQFRNGAVQVVSDVANGSPIMRLLWVNPNGLKQYGGGDVVGVGDEWDRHPGMNRLIFRADVLRPPAGPGGEDESACERQHEGEPNSQRAPPRFSHNSIYPVPTGLFGLQPIQCRSER